MQSPEKNHLVLGSVDQIHDGESAQDGQGITPYFLVQARIDQQSLENGIAD